jgi:hypothetical protein
MRYIWSNSIDVESLNGRSWPNSEILGAEFHACIFSALGQITAIGEGAGQKSGYLFTHSAPSGIYFICTKSLCTLG